jgi:hypothetical protein
MSPRPATQPVVEASAAVAASVAGQTEVLHAIADAATAWRMGPLPSLLPLAVSLALIAVAAPAAALVGPSQDGAAFSPVVVMVLEHAGATAGFCSGIVVAPDAVLTAAHCVPKGAAIRVHFRDEAGSPVLLSVADVAIDPGYRVDAVRKRLRSIDLALVHLPAALPDRFYPAALAARFTPANIGMPFRIAGFGVTREGDGTRSGQLRVADVAARAPLSDLLLWAHDPLDHGAGACEGDSGGPVFAATTEEVVAVTLWAAGSGGAGCGTLTQALWIAPQRSWIDSVLRRWGGGR